MGTKYYLYDWAFYRFIKNNEKYSIAEFYGNLREAVRLIIWYYEKVVGPVAGLSIVPDKKKFEVHIVMKNDTSYKVTRSWCLDLNKVFQNRKLCEPILFPNDYGNQS